MTADSNPLQTRLKNSGGQRKRAEIRRFAEWEFKKHHLALRLKPTYEYKCVFYSLVHIKNSEVIRQIPYFFATAQGQYLFS